LEIGVAPEMSVREAAGIAENLEKNVRRELEEAIEVSVSIRPARSYHIEC
ncbi:MAG TPA: hypothetical protein ENI41_08055, partial [Deltaproteobacteria bacterium]|nr:hypothetical protein [Deltaproteobacteria bacterium]